ncbi:MAG TPA: GGDEF domain-containing protein [Pirellulales bacterium]|nr:GGDEF domain-containing protein [Pirellulales bacterium]
MLHFDAVGLSVLLAAKLLLGFVLGACCFGSLRTWSSKRRPRLDGAADLETQLDDARRRIAEQELRLIAAIAEARVDPLTKVPNRRAFDEKADELHSLYERHGQRYALVTFDLDRFKTLNDAFGHAAGDAILAMVGRTCRATRRGTDHVARIGGEEFALLLPYAGLSIAAAVAQRYLRQIENSGVEIEGRPLRITTSAGVAAVMPGETSERLRIRADEALYAAKQAGRNRAFLHDGRGVRSADAASAIEHELALAKRLDTHAILAPADCRTPSSLPSMAAVGLRDVRSLHR